MPRLTQADLADLNVTFEARTPQELLRWTDVTFGTRAAAISAMQQAGSMLCHMLAELKLGLQVLFVDTGVSFPETLETRDRIADKYGLTIETLSPRQTMEEQTRELGVLYLTPQGQDQCCRLRKIAPLQAVADDYDALVGSLRRSDGGRRTACPILAVDPPLNCLRINPLVNVDDEQLAAYLAEHDVIVNPLHAQGYPTISCTRCTTPVLPNEPKRAGRWRHLGPWQIYCGLNPTDIEGQALGAIELPQELIDRILGRKADFVI